MKSKTATITFVIVLVIVLFVAFRSRSESFYACNSHTWLGPKPICKYNGPPQDFASKWNAQQGLGYESVAFTSGGRCQTEGRYCYRIDNFTPIGQFQNGTTTRYYDCCKPSCAWWGNAQNAGANGVVRSCGQGEKNACEDWGGSYSCENLTPFYVNANMAFGFAARSDNKYCGKCYELKFDGDRHNKPPNPHGQWPPREPGVNWWMRGKRMIIQVINNSAVGEVLHNHFDIVIPGGGWGNNNACIKIYGNYNFGGQWGGIDSVGKCSQLPPPLQKGCRFRWDWGKGFDNPTMQYRQIQCPQILTEISGIVNNTPD